MFTLKAENKRGRVIELTGNPSYEVLSVTGLNPPNATVNMSAVANLDGKFFNSSKINERNVVITLKINQPVEGNRIAIYDYFQAKQYIKIYYSNDIRDVYAEGYIDTMECDLFTENEVMQISIMCPNPFFKDVKESRIDFSQVIDLLEFLLSAPKEGIALSELDLVNRINIPTEHDTGIIMTLAATGYVQSPVVYNVETRRAFRLNLKMEPGDQIIVNTNRGEKSVLLFRSGGYTNIINYVSSNPDWFQLETGDNVFTYEAQSGSEHLTVSIIYRAVYEGV